MALKDVWLNLRGTMGNLLGVGGKAGVALKNSSGKLIIREGDDSANANIQVAAIEIEDAGTGDVITISAPTLTGNVNLVLPADDGSPGQFLQTNGSGSTSWASSSSNADITDSTDFDQTGGTLAMFTPPANALIRRVTAVVDSAAGGGSPTLKIGVTGTLDKYMETGHNDLKNTGIYETQPEIQETTALPIIATIVASSQTFSGRLYVTYAVPA